MAAKDTYRGINDMYYREPVKEQKSSKKTEETETSPEKKKPDPEYSITSLEIAALSQGFRMNKPYLVRGKVSKIAKDVKHKRVIIAVNAEYDSVKEDLCPYAEATIKDDLTFSIELKELRWHSKCYKDRQNGKDVQFAAWATAGGTTAQKSFDSAKVKLPDPKAFITLKKGNFDDVACKHYPDRCKKGGQGYIEGTVVNDLQDNVFIKLRFSPKSKTDGDFGENTERIIKDFQQCSLEKKRKKDGRIIEIEKITYSGKADGIVDEKTQNEIDLWIQEKYVKPVAILVHGDYDDEAISKGIKKTKEPDYYYKGTPVLDMQKDMQTFDLYLQCLLDGHFHDKTRDSLKEFQKIAMSKKRLANGQAFEADATYVTGITGRFDEETQAEFREWKEKGWKAPVKKEYYAEVVDDNLVVHTPKGSITYQANDYNMVQFPESGRGIGRGGQRDSYQYEDGVEKKNWGDNWANPKFAASIYNSIQEYLDSDEKYSKDEPFVYNDFSAYKPDYNLGHKSHKKGTDVDFRYMDKNGKGTNDWSKADKDRCNAFLKILVKNGCKRNFSHNGIIEETRHAEGHKDHIHVGY